MPQLPIEQRPAPRDELACPSTCCAGRNGLVDKLDAGKRHEMLNRVFDDLSSEASEDSPIILQRKSSRSKTMPVRQISIAEMLDDTSELGQEQFADSYTSDHEDAETVLGELMDATPYTRRHVESESKIGLEFGLPSTPDANSSSEQVGPVARPNVPAMRQIVLQIPIEVPAEMSAEDFAVQVVKNSCAVKRHALVVDLQVMLQSHAVPLAIETPTPVTATPTDSLSSSVSPYHSPEGAGSSSTSWSSNASTLLTSPCPEKSSRSNAFPEALMPSPCIAKHHAYAPLKPRNMGPGVKASNDGARQSMVCCHWKNKGFCKLGANCKFMHPMNKQGVGPTRRKGSGDSSEAVATCWHMAPPGIASTLSQGSNHRMAQINPMLPILSGGFPMMMPPPPPGGLASMLGLPLS